MIRSLTGRSLSYLVRVTFPYLTIMVAFVMFLAIYPEVVLWLPSVLYR